MLGDVTRSIGLIVTNDSCEAATVVAVDRALSSTRVGQAGLALTALLAGALVVVARWRRGGWWRRFLWAAPIGLLFGAAEVAVLHESGRVDPLGSLPWWPFAAGLALAAVLPLTRRRGHRAGVPEAMPLRQLMTSGASLSGPQVVTLVLEVAAALPAVRARGVTPQVRPETIWINRAGQVWLADPVGPPASPYASPEQIAGAAQPARAEVWACGMVLAELLTGRPPERSSLPELPTPLAEVVATALAPDPAYRFASVEAFAAALRAAAEQEWGPDWTARGALAGALAAHGAIGSAAAGYAGLASGASAGSSGFGAAASAGVAQAGTAGLSAAGAGVAGGTGTAGFGAAGATFAVAGKTAGGTTVAAIAAGKVSGLTTTTAAAIAAVVVAAGGVAADAAPPRRDHPVVTPDQAKVIVVRTLEQARSGGTDHLTEWVGMGFASLLESHEEVRQATIAEVAVGVPPTQYEFPAWFISSAQLRFDGGVVHVLGRFERERSSARWQMVTLSWLLNEPLGRPQVDDDGWVLPLPEPAELLVDPAELPQRYADWSQASFDAGRHVEDDVLRSRELGGDRETIRDYRVRAVNRTRDNHAIVQETILDESDPTVVWLEDGNALVSFTVVSRQTNYNGPRPGETRPCDSDAGYFQWAPDMILRYRQLSYYAVVHVLAWVPTRDSGEDTVLILDPRPVQRLDKERSILC